MERMDVCFHMSFDKYFNGRMMENIQTFIWQMYDVQPERFYKPDVSGILISSCRSTLVLRKRYLCKSLLGRNGLVATSLMERIKTGEW